MREIWKNQVVHCENLENNTDSKRKEPGMLHKNLQELLEGFKKDQYCTAAQMADALKISEKTARLRIKELNSELIGYGAKIISKPRFGYQLIIEDEEKFGVLKEEKTEILPENEQERSEYLLAYLIWHTEYVKSEDLCEFLYISKTTLTRSIKSVEMILKRYDLGIDRRPNYGIRLCGKESDIRRLISDYFIKRNCFGDFSDLHSEQEMLHLAERVRKLMGKYEIRLSETSFENFINYVYVAWKRMRHGHFLKMKIENLPEIGKKECAFSKKLIDSLEESGQIIYTEDEKNYLLLYLAGKRMIGNVVENESNFIIHEQTDRLALAMLNVVKQSYHMDFYNNFDVRMTLNQHLVPFDIRMRFGIPLENPLLQNIKEEYSLAYQISCEAVQVLGEYYQKEISEDEIGYFALIFELAMEKTKNDQKSDILVVCSTGKGSSRLLKYKYEQEFSEYLDNIYVCDLLDLDQFDFSKIQYIFTTVPITKEVPVPIAEVGVFLGTDDIKKITEILKRGSADYLEMYYAEKRFFPNFKGNSKAEVLERLCSIILEQEEVDDDFYEMVLEREAYIQMDYGYQIAIPHPNRIASEETFAYVAVLEKPVIWNQNPVQVVVLTSVGRKEDKNRQKFYEATAKFALSADSIHRLICEQRYETLMELIKES